MPAEFLKLWYSFDVGPIHNLVWSTELDYSRGSEQFNFILNVSPDKEQHKTGSFTATMLHTADDLSLLT